MHYARSRITGAEIAEDRSRCPKPDRLGIAHALRELEIGSDGLGQAAARRYERSCCGRSRTRRRQEALADRARRRQAGHRRLLALHGLRSPTATDADVAKAGWEFVHVCVDDATGLAYVEVLDDERATHRGRVSAPSDPLLCPPWGNRRASHHRQRLRLSLDDRRDRLPGAGDQAPAHSASPPSDQRQGRALHPHDARWLGLRRDLPQLRRAHRSARRAGYGATTSGATTAPSAEDPRQLGSPS